MREQLAKVIGLVAVVLYGLGYLQKKKRNIVLLGAISRVLYVVQYLLLFAFGGAAMDVLGATGTFLAGRQDTNFMKKYTRVVMIVLGVLMVGVGVTICVVEKDAMELLPLVGVLLQTGALFLRDEKKIRVISLIGSPFWLTYNICSGSTAWLGDVWCITSLLIAITRYDIMGKRKKKL